MKALVVLVVLALIVLVAVALVRRAAARRSNAPWRLEERSDGELVTVHAVRPGNAPLLIGSTPVAAEDFTYRIEEVRATGEEKLVALNSGRRRLSR